jgi:hypothetical protein
VALAASCRTIEEADVGARVNVTVLQTALVTGFLAASSAVAWAQSYELIAAAKEEGALTTMALA